MKRHPEIFVNKNTIQSIADSISCGLFNANVDYLRNNLAFNNFQGNINLNFIFSELIKIENDFMKVFPYKRGPFSFPIIYDIESKTLITLTSELNTERLLKRKTGKAHYMDGLTLFNTDFFGDEYQYNLFDMMEEPPSIEEREWLKNSMVSWLSDKEIQQYVVAQYRIQTLSFSFLAFWGVLISENFIKLKTDDWSEYIRPNYENEAISNALVNATANEKQDDYLDKSIKIKKHSDVTIA